MIKCKKCGRENKEESSFCVACGEKLKDNAQTFEQYIENYRRLKEQIDVQDNIITTSKLKLDDLKSENKQLIDSHKHTKKILGYIIIGILLCLCGYYIYSYYDNKSRDKSLKVEDVSFIDFNNRIEGNYSLKQIYNGEQVGNIRTSIIRKSELGYNITIITDFGPKHHTFVINENNKLSSETIGHGTISYKKNVDKIIITFKSGENVWEFTK